MKRILVFLVTLLTLFAARSDLEEGTVIRDAEIEEILRSYLDPLLEKAGLDKQDLNLVLVVDKTVNAAATINTTLIINSGFLLRTTSLSEVLGVLAHEVGHLEGRHIIRMIDAMDQATKANAFSVAAGLALGLLTQRADLGAAIAVGSSISGMYSFLSYNRGEEASADQAALKYLNALCWPADGMVSFFEKLLGQELLSTEIQDPYARSHPLTKDRLESVRAQVKNLCKKPLPEKMLTDYETLKIKLEAFLLSPDQVLAKYSSNKYARAIAYYRQGKIGPAIQLLDVLLEKTPNNPYYHELKGQIYYENGKISSAIISYRKALSLKPEEALFQISLAQSLIAEEKTLSTKEAKEGLEKAQKKEPDNPTIWQLLSVVYGRLNQMGSMAIALAEKAVLLKKWDEAHEQARRALHHLKKTDRLYLRAQDLEIQTERERNKKTQTQTL